jgi:hypothetical protein
MFFDNTKLGIYPLANHGQTELWDGQFDIFAANF